MKDLCVPVPNLGDEEFADIEIKVGEKRTNLNYRVVSFPWEEEDGLTLSSDDLEQSLARIYRLKRAIESYDNEWELIQIYNPSENASHIQVLYRKK
jgi:hypothetical protein